MVVYSLTVVESMQQYHLEQTQVVRLVSKAACQTYLCENGFSFTN